MPPCLFAFAPFPLPVPYALRNVRWQMAATSPAAALKVSQALRMRESVVSSSRLLVSSRLVVRVRVRVRARGWQSERITKAKESDIKMLN